MASISGVSSSNMTSSLYNSANTITGLASGLDTEGMIESLVKSYQTKINQLNQKATKTEWKQEAYRSIINKMVGFTNKYTSYTSATNLMSPNFFSNAVKMATKGLYADKVSASGKTSSDIALNAVHRLASAAEYRVGDSRLNSGDGTSIQAGTELDLTGKTTLGSLQGSLSIAYGSNTLNLNFDQVNDVKAMDEIRANLAKQQGVDEKDVKDADVLAGLINQKLAGQKITFSNGKTENAEDRIQVSVKDGAITFSDKSTAGNAVYLSGASGNVAKKLGLDLDDAKEKQPNSFKVNYDLNLTEEVDNIDYLSGKGMNLNLNGTTKTIYLPKVEKVTGETEGSPVVYKINGEEVAEDQLADKYASALNEAVKTAFNGKEKITVSNEGTGGKLKLNFKVNEEGSDLLINTDVGETLGIGRAATTYLNTSKTLGDLLGDKLNALTAAKGEDGKDMLDEKGNKMYAFEINGVTVGNFSKESKLSDVMSAINGSKDAGVKLSYSQTTKEFLFSAKETGESSSISIKDGGLAAAMFGKVDDTTAGYSKGQDAEFTATINGKQMTMTRSTNSVSLDGLTINMKETFDGSIDKDGNQTLGADGKPVYKADNSVTFQSSTDSDKIVDAVKSMIEDYNAILSEVRGAYSTLPAQKSDGSSYEPLSEDDTSGWSQSAIDRYEEKAKQGILFGDNDLSALYNKLRYVFSPSGEDGAILRGMGISTSYDISTGALSVTLDEDKLRSMLDSDPDMVSDAFTKTSGLGGVMQNMKTTLDAYAKTTGEPKGILIQKSGSPLSPLSLMNNTWQKQIDNYNSQIEKWQDKLSSQVDRYTQQFSRLEQLIQQMNSQSSALAGLMGG